MIKIILTNIILPLVITIIIETITAYILGYKKRNFIIAVIAVNGITNPVLNCIILLYSSITKCSINIIYVLIMEVIVVITEWKILKSCFKNEKGLLRLSVIMNSASYITGLLLYLIGIKI